MVFVIVSVLLSVGCGDAQLAAHDLAGGRHGKGVSELDEPRILMRGDSSATTPSRNTRQALMISVRIASGTPTTPAKATAGCCIRQSSISPGPMR
jgi:hypothetical protein